MVARINTGKSISKALNYNEQKVQLSKAALLSATNFLKEANGMNFYDKLHRFELLTSLNERTKTNSLHISLNFDPSESYSTDVLINIANTYMQKIGFGEQPFLIYQHHDSGHPHIHIVSTNIDRYGNRISTHNLGKNQSEKARKEIEIEYGLVKAESKKNAEQEIIPINVAKVIYGKAATKQAIATVLAAVINRYKYTSLHELNAVLGLYNVVADRGTEDSRKYRHNGLTYQVLDAQGKKVGVPVKASAFFMKPTMSFLEKNFVENAPLKVSNKKRLKTTIDWVLLRDPKNLASFTAQLEKEQISVVCRKNNDGLLYGLTYIDHRTKSVFNGSDIGKVYSAKAIQDKFQLNQLSETTIKTLETQQNREPISLLSDKGKQEIMPLNIVDALPHKVAINYSPESSAPFIPIKKKKKKKRIRL